MYGALAGDDAGPALIQTGEQHRWFRFCLKATMKGEEHVGMSECTSSFARYLCAGSIVCNLCPPTVSGRLLFAASATEAPANLVWHVHLDPELVRPGEH